MILRYPVIPNIHHGDPAKQASQVLAEVYEFVEALEMGIDERILDEFCDVEQCVTNLRKMLVHRFGVLRLRSARRETIAKCRRKGYYRLGSEGHRQVMVRAGVLP